ncbi:MerR family transcriptional regulator [Geosporobacter ferrireducens]|uniref:HTH merR-type domain-containing protein n=1 Tax=Geosporobacter ferrireducens TaxID=1424294 RepID=A0A1D8GB11_9FIRM|nr:MerR family transcriptional regulator [Geosporobacter ferrireducens]AOT68101.1 hypothetical protein Gferi_00010 [Geosporobacter ferrireducens]AOT73341.1 hypothetical protein Gferi_27290 [Geosporobacter ferrireducens]MTI55335.1 MerR family transcriptional regulator [Geosporobacter ferrireducens]
MIDKEKKYSISEVSKITDYDTHVLRYYEDEFKLEIPRTNSNRRYYTYKEIEQFIYIKELQEKGLTNKQIKLILDTPEILVHGNHEVAVTASSSELSIINQPAELELSSMLEELCNRINHNMNEQLQYKIDETKNEIINHFDDVVQDMEGNETHFKKEKDILICENARLKMRLKQKSYELAELKEQVKKLNTKQPLWKKIFGEKKDVVL